MVDIIDVSVPFSKILVYVREVVGVQICGYLPDHAQDSKIFFILPPNEHFSQTHPNKMWAKNTS